MLVDVAAHRMVDLGGQHHVVAPPAQCLPDDLLRLAAGVNVGGVDDVDPRVERGVDDARAGDTVGVAERAEHHRAQTKLAHLDAGTA